MELPAELPDRPETGSGGVAMVRRPSGDRERRWGANLGLLPGDTLAAGDVGSASRGDSGGVCTEPMKVVNGPVHYRAVPECRLHSLYCMAGAVVNSDHAYLAMHGIFQDMHHSLCENTKGQTCAMKPDIRPCSGPLRAGAYLPPAVWAGQLERLPQGCHLPFHLQ